MATQRAHCVILAGPNGAGKTTAAPSLLRDLLGLTNFVNADVIAQGLSGFDPERAAIEAGRVMLKRLRELAERRENFAFETTLASRTFAPWLRTIRTSHDYDLTLFYCWLPSPEHAIARVQRRVTRGGHFVDPDTVRRRYSRGLRNFFDIYRDLADEWHFVNNSNKAGPQPIAFQRSGCTIEVVDPPLWAAIVEQYDDQSRQK